MEVQPGSKRLGHRYPKKRMQWAQEVQPGLNWAKDTKLEGKGTKVLLTAMQAFPGL